MLYECDRFCNIRIFLNSISILLLCSIFVALFSSQGSHNSSFQANRLIGHTVPVNKTSLIVDTISLYHLPTQTCFWTIEGLSLKCYYECTNIPPCHTTRAHSVARLSAHSLLTFPVQLAVPDHDVLFYPSPRSIVDIFRS